MTESLRTSCLAAPRFLRHIKNHLVQHGEREAQQSGAHTSAQATRSSAKSSTAFGRPEVMPRPSTLKPKGGISLTRTRTISMAQRITITLTGVMGIGLSLLMTDVVRQCMGRAQATVIILQEAN